MLIMERFDFVSKDRVGKEDSYKETSGEKSLNFFAAPETVDVNEKVNQKKDLKDEARPGVTF